LAFNSQHAMRAPGTIMAHERHCGYQRVLMTSSPSFTKTSTEDVSTNIRTDRTAPTRSQRSARPQPAASRPASRKRITNRVHPSSESESAKSSSSSPSTTCISSPTSSSTISQAAGIVSRCSSPTASCACPRRDATSRTGR